MVPLFARSSLSSHLVWTIWYISLLTFCKGIIEESTKSTDYYYGLKQSDSRALRSGDEENWTKRELEPLRDKTDGIIRPKRKQSDHYSSRSERMRLNRGTFQEEEELEKELMVTYEFIIAGNLSSSEISSCCRTQIKAGTLQTLSKIEGLLLNDEKSTHYVKITTKRECEISYPRYYVKVKFLSHLFIGNTNEVTQSLISNEIVKSVENGDLERNILRQGVSLKQAGAITTDGGTTNFCAVVPSAQPSNADSSRPSASPVRAPLSMLFQIAITSGKTAVELVECCRQQILSGARRSINNILAGLSGRRRVLHKVKQEPEGDSESISGSKAAYGVSTRQTTLSRRDETVEKYNVNERKTKKKCKQYNRHRQLDSSMVHLNRGSSKTPDSYLRSHSFEYNSQDSAVLSPLVRESPGGARLLSLTHRKKDYTYCQCGENYEPIPPCENDVYTDAPTVSPTNAPTYTPSNNPSRNPIVVLLELVEIKLVYVEDNINSNIDAYFSITLRNRDAVFENEDVVSVMQGELEDEVKSGRLTENIQQEGLNITAELASNYPSASPSSSPSRYPSITPSKTFSKTPSTLPTNLPTSTPSSIPSLKPSIIPSVDPSNMPSTEPHYMPSTTPNKDPSVMPSSKPSLSPSTMPTEVPSVIPSSYPSYKPSVSPSNMPSLIPSVNPSNHPSSKPSLSPSTMPTQIPSSKPSLSPFNTPSQTPSVDPTSHPSSKPTANPTHTPSLSPTSHPSSKPTANPTHTPSFNPTSHPSSNPTANPTQTPTFSPSDRPSLKSSVNPTGSPSKLESSSPSSFSYEYVGCFNDKRERALPYVAGIYMETKECQLTCSLAGFKYAAIQWWGECYCADSGYDKYGSSDLCNCDGPNFGPWLNCVYKIDEPSSYETRR